ncbi:MAG: flagellar assembly protein FliW [Clostridia bacterium]|nr:flagellar assembly protein FliW [Clostridia bacterium]
MKINTKHFGEVDIEENKIINFAEGIPGFPNSKNYVMLAKKDQSNLFCWLQSVEEADTAFAMTVPYIFYPDYKPDVADSELATIGVNTQEDLQDLSVFNIMVIPNDAKNATVNLKAPVVINEKAGKGGQFIANNADYTVRHRISDLVQMYA